MSHLSDQYAKEAALAQLLISKLEYALKDHRAAMNAAPNHWGFVGDIIHVNSQLTNILRTFTTPPK